MNHNLTNTYDISKDRVALIICLCTLFFWYFLLGYKYQHYGYSDWDLAIYDQIVWTITQGSTYSSLIGFNFLADHTHFIAFLIAPIYYLCPHPMTLIFLKVLSFVVGAFIFYKIANRSLEKQLALILMLLYIIHPANIFMLFYEFQFENLAISFIFLLIYFFLTNKSIPFLMTAFVLLLIKENMVGIVVMFGIYGLFVKDNKIRWGVLPIVLGVLIFFLSVFVIIPFIRQSLPTTSSVYLNLYSKTPVNIVKPIWDTQNLHYTFDLFGPFLFIAWGWKMLILGMPIFLQNLLSKAWQMHTIHYHYAATLVPFIAVASIAGMAYLQKILKRLKYLILYFFFGAMIIFNFYHYGPLWQEELNGWINKTAGIKEDMVKQIPSDAGVIASFSFLSHLTHRHNLYAIYNVSRDANFIIGQKPYVIPNDIQYALMDFKDEWFLPKNIKEEYTNNLKEFLFNDNWVVQQRHGDIVLFRKK